MRNLFNWDVNLKILLQLVAWQIYDKENTDAEEEQSGAGG